MRQSVEADIARLKMMLTELAGIKSDFGMQIDSLAAERESMKTAHEEVATPFYW